MKYKLKASQLITIVRMYKNWQEKRKLGTREQMWDFHWAAGTANFTIWAMLYDDYVERNYQGQPWCAMYGADTMVLAFIKYCGMTQQQAVTAAKNMYGGHLPYNCQLFVNQHSGDKKLNHTPAVGASVIFWTGSKYGHWGTVSSVDKNGKDYTSVEGNTSGGKDKVDPDGGAVVEKWHRWDNRTLFWHPEYAPETKKEPLALYNVSCGRLGLKITATTLNIRTEPGATGTETIEGVYQYGEHIYPIQKCFIDGKAWYRTERGWISARYVEGWVLEDNGRWWYVIPGYDFSVNKWQKISGIWYYFDNTGYMVESEWIQDEAKYYYLTESGEMARNAYIKSIDKELYYLVDEDGVWNPERDTSRPDLNKYQLVH